MEYIERSLTNLRFSSTAWKVFIISLLAAFLMVALPRLGIGQTPVNVSPIPRKTDPLDLIKDKLEQKPTSFKLKKPHSFIPNTYAASSFENARAHGVVDFGSGEILLSKNSSEKLPIASLTKIMTAVVALDLAPLPQKFVVSQKASRQVPTKVMLKRGEVYTLEHLLKSLLLSSANDSAQVIKEGVDDMYGGEIFIRAMNAKAKSLGLQNTRFANPQGFDDPESYSSVEDLMVLSQYALTNYPFIAQVVAKEYEDLNLTWGENRFFLNNWNGLIGVYTGVKGVKIGNTENAGKTTVVVAEREGKTLLAVILGAPGTLERDLWAAELLDLGFDKVARLKPVAVTEEQLLAKYSSWRY